MEHQSENNQITGHADTMNSLIDVSNKMMKQGYTETFKVVNGMLQAISNKKDYRPDEISIINFYRFEGASDPADNSIMYVIETNDGLKGTIVDAYGPYADRNLEKFMNEVEDISKKTKMS